MWVIQSSQVTVAFDVWCGEGGQSSEKPGGCNMSQEGQEEQFVFFYIASTAPLGLLCR